MSLPEKNQEFSSSMRRAKIRTLLQNYEEIPTVPSMVETITALTADVNCSLAALEAAIKTDQSCVARLFQMANSAFYGAGANRTVTSVRRAILMFGFNAVQNITMSLTTFDCFRTQNAAEIATVHAIRLHSVAVATLAQRIAQTCPRDLDPELAYCAGLLHDLGRVVLLRLFPQEYHQLLTQCARDCEPDMSKVEFDTFAVTHAVAGQWLGEHWHFPPPILQVIATHHSTQAANPLVATVMLANTLANMYGAGLGGAVRSSSMDSLLRTLGLSPGQIDQYTQYLASELPHLHAIVSYS
jgi:putative nucleotidyltransferase with HDIG domain